MPLDWSETASPPPATDDFGEGGGIYCKRCDQEDCTWFGVCPHTPDLWLSLNPHSELAQFRARRRAARNAQR